MESRMGVCVVWSKMVERERESDKQTYLSRERRLDCTKEHFSTNYERGEKERNVVTTFRTFGWVSYY